jgi:hypothetical protein
LKVFNHKVLILPSGWLRSNIVPIVESKFNQIDRLKKSFTELKILGNERELQRPIILIKVMGQEGMLDASPPRT